MIEYISGKVEQLTPTYAIVGNGQMGYEINISLYTYGAMVEGADVRLLIHEVIREDAYTLYGFATARERNIFRALITVSGIGANTARMILSKLSPEELEMAIVAGNVDQIKSVKGIGLKTAQRVIIDLKDKIQLDGSIDNNLLPKDNTARDESLSALVMLGFQKAAAEKVVDKVLKDKPTASVEEIIKLSLNRL